MSYYSDVFLRRSQHYGVNMKDTVENSVIKDFESYLLKSPNAKEGICGGKTIQLVLLTNKQDEFKTTKYILTRYSENILPGNVIRIEGKDWLVFYQRTKNLQTYKASLACECNNSISWVDEFGIVKNSLCYIIGSGSAKIKENFRTWNNLITPQPNKALEIILPTNHILNNQRFIIGDEAWFVVDKDNISVNGILYLSLTESKINEAKDSLPGKIANLDEAGHIQFEIPFVSIEVNVGTPLVIPAKILNSGVATDYTWSIMKDSPFVSVDEKTIICAGVGTYTLTLVMDLDHNISETIEIKCVETVPVSTLALIGDDSIKLNRTKTYQLIDSTNTTITSNIVYTVEQSDNFASIESIENGICTVKANANNKIGTIKLKANYNDMVYEKTISILPLW